MAHYAFLDENNIVTEVITGIDENETDNLPDEFDSWEDFYADFRGQACKRTSYNTKNNEHVNDGTPFRGNYAGIGYSYDADNDVFISQSPFPSWIKTDNNCSWKAPVDMPDDGKNYVWNEDIENWEEEVLD